MGKPAAVIRLTDEEEKTLKQYLRAGTAHPTAPKCYYANLCN